MMVYKCLHGLAPPYLAADCVPVTSVASRRHLRSAVSGCLAMSAPEKCCLSRAIQMFALLLLLLLLYVVQSDRPKLDDLRGNLNIGMTLQSARNIAKLGSKMLYAPVSGVLL